jgi:hypothetical protein
MKTGMVIVFCLLISFGYQRRALADFWGGDLPLLAEIVTNTAQELIQIENLLSNARDSYSFLKDINEGAREAMGIMRTLNSTMHAGILSQYNSPVDVLHAIEDLYGMIPQTGDAKMEALNDQSVAEAVTLHNQAFQYADLIDPEAERIKDYAQKVSPMGAGRLTAQSMGVLIHVTNQVLRTNAAILKIMSENLALQNRRTKAESVQFKTQYEGLSNSIKDTRPLKELSKLD